MFLKRDITSAKAKMARLFKLNHEEDASRQIKKEVWSDEAEEDIVIVSVHSGAINCESPTI